MAEIRQIQTTTSISKVSNTILIETKYLQAGGDTYLFIAEENGNINGVNYMQGEEVAVISQNDVDFFIDINGNLVVNAPDPQNYTIDSMGNLRYTEN